MEYEILVEKDSNGRVIVDFYGLDFDITNEFVDGRCHKVIFGDPIIFVLKGAEVKDETVENSNTAEESPETHEGITEPEHPETSEEKHDDATEESEKHGEPSEETQPNNDSQQGASEGTTHEESPAAEAEQPVENASEENHAPDGSNNENTPAEEDVMKDPKETEHNPETQEGEN